jgi:hypothetical protein
MTFDIPYVGTKPPKVGEIHIVVPLSRPEMVGRVRANLERQRLRAPVVVVENGAAIGACKAQGFTPDVLLTSGAHQSLARNAALAYLREHHVEAYWVSMDDDDYYGSEYVAEHAGLAKRGQCVGKSTHWIIFEGFGTVVLRPWASSGSGKHVNGATIGAFVADSPDFLIRDVGEDTIFSNTFVAGGGKVWLSSPYHTAYCRRNDGRAGHTYPCYHKELLQGMGGRYLAYAGARYDLIEGANFEMGELLTTPNLPGWLGV